MTDQERYTGLERRKSTRWYGNIPCECVFFYDARDAECLNKSAAVVCDLSCKGLCIEAEDVSGVQMKQILSGVVKIGVRLILPGRIEVNAIAQGSWVKEDTQRKYVLGVGFCDITRACEDALKEFVIDFYLEKGKV